MVSYRCNRPTALSRAWFAGSGTQPLIDVSRQLVSCPGPSDYLLGYEIYVEVSRVNPESHRPSPRLRYEKI